MEEVRIQKQDRSVSFRVATDAGEFIVFDMSLSSPTRNRTLFSGKEFSQAWAAAEAVLGEIAVPDELLKFATTV
ncbi:hypothetical protein [Paenibacillus sp. FSL H8-0259]|uniref:hypothetical protein n=1 Tax=Paenibacillus sp. FSL H8-0259 TaxID=1920423 RepID=UPI00096DBEF6|nr:hypothetical protein [Paenibacillus sp. FSL H8-0259]OMF31216.1 hypothetical protein BK132_07325 [Paenibacillus sp. FSL H8-0259]